MCTFTRCIRMYNLFLDEPFVYFLKYIHLTQCIHHSVHVETINKVYMYTLCIQMYTSAQNFFYICKATFVIFCYTSILHSFPWTTISECIRVLDVSECTISFLMSHFYIFFKYIHHTQCIPHSVHVDTINKVYMCTLCIQMYTSAQYFTSTSFYLYMIHKLSDIS